MNLSPSQQSVLDALKRHGIRSIPQEAVLAKKDPFLLELLRALGGIWAYSWEISQESKTVDYRRRFTELRKKGYDIVSFHVPWTTHDYEGLIPINYRTITRHGYILVEQPKK